MRCLFTNNVTIDKQAPSQNAVWGNFHVLDSAGKFIVVWRTENKEIFKKVLPLWERNGLPIRRRNQRLAVVRWLHSFLSCCPSGNCLFPPLKRAEERMRWRPWCETQTPWYFGLLGHPTKPALRNPQPNISGQPGVVTPHLSFSFLQKKNLWMISIVIFCTFLKGILQTYLHTV